MGTVAGFMLLALGPSACLWVFAKVIELVGRWECRPDPNYRPTVRGLDVLVEDLRRLEGDYERVVHSREPAKAARLRALSMAYDQTLAACCAELGLPDPGGVPLSGIARLQVEADLAQHGVRW